MAYTFDRFESALLLSNEGTYSFNASGSDVPDILTVSATTSGSSSWDTGVVIRRRLQLTQPPAPALPYYSLLPVSGTDVDGGTITISGIGYLDNGSTVESLDFTLNDLTAGTTNAPNIYNIRVGESGVFLYWPTDAGDSSAPGPGVSVPQQLAGWAIPPPLLVYPPVEGAGSVTIYWYDENPDSVLNFTYKIFRTTIPTTMPNNGLLPTSLYETLNGVTLIATVSVLNWSVPMYRVYTDTSVSNGESYWYRIRADYEIMGVGLDVQATPLDGPTAIVGLSASAISISTIILQWISLGPGFDIEGNFYRVQYEKDGVYPDDGIVVQGDGTIGNNNTPNTDILTLTDANPIYIGATVTITVQQTPVVLVNVIVLNVYTNTIQVSKSLAIPNGRLFTFTNLPTNSHLYPAQEGSMGRIVAGLSNVSTYRFRVRGESDQVGPWTAFVPTADVTGIAQGATASNITLAADAVAVNNYYLGRLIEITAGTGNGSFSTIIEYDGPTKIATIFGTFQTTPGMGQHTTSETFYHRGHLLRPFLSVYHM